MSGPPSDKPGSAPRAAAVKVPATALELVQALDKTFREQVRRALDFSLDGSIESLAFVDHYLRMAADESREPIIGLIAGGAGAYFGNLVADKLGATWIGDGRTPRRLRLLMTPQLIHFSPVDQAYEAICSRALSPDDPRIADGPAFDSSFQLRVNEPPDDEHEDDDDDDDDLEVGAAVKPEGVQDDATWLEERLGELSPVPEDQFHSLTTRFETLQLMLELLAGKHAHEGRSPRDLALSDYAAALRPA